MSEVAVDTAAAGVEATLHVNLTEGAEAVAAAVNATAHALEAAATAADPNHLLIAYAAILLMSLGPIILGSWRSLSSPVPVTEHMSQRDAIMFPVTASATLLGLFLLFKFIDPSLVSTVLVCYLMLFGVFAVGSTISPWLQAVLPAYWAKAKHHRLTLRPFWDDSADQPTVIDFNDVDVLGVAVGCALGGWYMWTRHWVANNVFGLAFSVQAVSMLALGSWKTGAGLLCALFFYDIFWVFYTPVMVAVAKNLDAPIKLLFPRDLFADTYQFSMLGLGDIVLPGIFLALLLRFDRDRQHSRPGFSRLYFWSGFVAYVLGLATTIAVMHFFKAAQPALLYLVPFCVLVPLGVAVVRGEASALIGYEENPGGASPVASAAIPVADAGKRKKRTNTKKK